MLALQDNLARIEVMPATARDRAAGMAQRRLSRDADSAASLADSSSFGYGVALLSADIIVYLSAAIFVPLPVPYQPASTRVLNHGIAEAGAMISTDWSMPLATTGISLRRRIAESARHSEIELVRRLRSALCRISRHYENNV